MSPKRSIFKKSLLDNGIVLLTEHAPQFQSLAVGVWVKAGTRHESPEEEGLSHFLEHMMFKGTSKRSALEIAQAIDRVGGDFNAFTAREYTCFHILLLSRDLRLAIEILSDVLLNSSFDSGEIEREKKVVLQEVMMTEDNPEEFVHDVFFEQAFGKHPLGKPILGTRETIASFDRRMVVSYFKKHYSPEKLIISLAGDIDHDEVKKLLNRSVGQRLSKHPKNKSGLSNLHAPRVHPSVKTIKHATEQTQVVVGYPSATVATTDRYVATLMATWLGGGMSSVLFQEIREKRGLAYSIYASLSPFSDSGLMTIYVGTDPKEVKTCLEITGRELAKLRNHELTKKQLDMIKDNIKGTMLLNMDSVETRMMMSARNEMFLGRQTAIEEMCAAVDRVTSREMQKYARQTLDPKQMIMTAMGPNLTRKLAQLIS